jgi:hypothetical protein
MNHARVRGLRPYNIWPLVSSGKSAVGLLIRQLNASGRKRGVQEPRELVRNVNEVDRLIREKGYPNTRSTANLFDRPGNLKAGLGKRGFDAGTLRLLSEIQRGFSSFKLTLWPLVPEKRGWKFYCQNPWAGTPGNRRALSWVFLAVICDLAVAGRLRRVRECDSCRRWFFGCKDEQRFCSDTCREKWWRATPAGKAKRAEYMRGYRGRLRRRDREILGICRRQEKIKRK